MKKSVHDAYNTCIYILLYIYRSLSNVSISNIWQPETEKGRSQAGKKSILTSHRLPNRLTDRTHGGKTHLTKKFIYNEHCVYDISYSQTNTHADMYRKYTENIMYISSVYNGKKFLARHVCRLLLWTADARTLTDTKWVQWKSFGWCCEILC